MIQSTLARWFREALAGGKLDRFLGKRSSMRCHWAVPLELGLEGEILAAEGRDFSPKGVGFVCERGFEPGEMLDLRRNGEQDWVKIRVKHCSKYDSEFMVGAVFECPSHQDKDDRESRENALTSTPPTSDQIRREKRLRQTTTTPPSP